MRLREWAAKWLVGAAAFLYDLFGSFLPDLPPVHFIPHSLSGSLRVFLTKHDSYGVTNLFPFAVVSLECAVSVSERVVPT